MPANQSYSYVPYVVVDEIVETEAVDAAKFWATVYHWKAANKDMRVLPLLSNW